jgi:SAM-dependent methyltransferase
MDRGDLDTEERTRQRDLVRRGYDAISRAYRDDEGHSNPTTAEDVTRYLAWVEELTRRLKPSARVLDLGCGAGVPGTKLLVGAGFEVVGLDFSHVQIERARQLVRGATFVEADIATWDFDPASFDAVVSFYAVIHMPLRDQQDLFPRLRRWLRPGGVFLAIVGHDRWTGLEDYLGAPMFWDHADFATYLDWLEQADLNPVWHRFVPEGKSGHVLVLAGAGDD